MSRQCYQGTETQVVELQRAYQQAKGGATRTRLQAVKLYLQRYPVSEILEITGCSRTSLMEWCSKYRGGGIAMLEDHRGGPIRAKLRLGQVEELSQKLRQYKPYDLLGPAAHTPSGQYWTVEDLAQAVEKWYGVTWKSRTSYHDLLDQCGFSYQRTEKVYKSRREREVAEFEAMVEKRSD